MRLIVDLQACQTASRTRGIGRYVGSLARAIVAARGSDGDTFAALDGTCADAANQVRTGLRDLLPACNFTRYYYPRPVLPEGDSADPRRAISSQLIARHYGTLSPDAVLLGSMFEGYVEPVVTCENLCDVPGSVSACLIYDLIPLIYPDHYLRTARQQAWYSRKLQALRNCDLLLAISEATRNDAIHRLGFPADRIVNIRAAIARVFRRLDAPRESFETKLRALGISRKYLLYTGNDDFRKNVEGALEAFARLPAALRAQYQLVLNQVDRQRVVEQLLPRFELAEEEVVITGYVSDDDLVMLLNYCDLFIFPSLYEGFGLPVLEAMACGAPVIGGDNSSIPELIHDPEARFDASDPAAISACIQRALTDKGFRRVLREHGSARARAFTWGTSAALASEAIEDATRRKQATFRVPVRPRCRLAMFTPLPPEQTGIANYSAELLPHLARHFAIDVYTTAIPSETTLAASFNVRPWQDFDARAEAYNGIVYQVGNSPFHSHMFEMLARHPGVVVMHDFFLSSAFWHMDRLGGRRGAFENELAFSHGARALQDLNGPDGDAICRARYPCNRRVLERSIGVIAHSSRIHELLIRYGMKRLAKPVRVVPQLHSLPSMNGPSRRSEIRSRLGYHPDDWLICSFGFVADTKLSDHLVCAIAKYGLSDDRHVHLIFVGQMDGSDYCARLKQRVASSGMAERVHVTGFVANEVYQDYLAAADVAVQLRAKSRGETSRAVLDCLAHGLPVIVNAHGTMNDYPEAVLVRVDEHADPAALAGALTRLRDDPAMCRTMGARGRTYVAEDHSPARIADEYASAIDEMLARRMYIESPTLAADIGPLVAGREDAPELIDAAGEALSRNVCVNTWPALVIDLSELVHVDYGTGIHRVVRNLTRELMGLGGNGMTCVPAYLDGNEYRVASDYARERFGVSYLTMEGRVEFAPGDTLLLLDSAWSDPERFRPVLCDAESRGAEIVGFVYDLIPLRHPDTCVPEMPSAFRGWLEHVIRESHAIICISRATADDLIAFVGEHGLRHRPGLRIHYVHLGSDLDGAVSGEPAEAVVTVFDLSRRPTFLMVGTLEPRKGHVEVLEAFERIWAAGYDVVLCMIGKVGWKMGPFTGRLQAHPELGKRLFWLEHVSDVDLNYAYLHAAALIQASHAEGFGLPLLEAARCGTPVVCSDIPVFREVAGDATYYFPVGSIEGIAQSIQNVLDQPGGFQRAATCAPRTWRDAALDVMRVLGPRSAYCTLN